MQLAWVSKVFFFSRATINSILRYCILDPDFDSHHFSAWGRQLLQDCDLIQDMVAKYQPDYLLVLLGFNDMGWFVSDADGTFESMKTFISEARAAKPDIKMALGNVPHRKYIPCRDDLPRETSKYNKMLEIAIPFWSKYIFLFIMSQERALYKWSTGLLRIRFRYVGFQILSAIFSNNG
jgi:hypothetical protein